MLVVLYDVSVYPTTTTTTTTSDYLGVYVYGRWEIGRVDDRKRRAPV